MFFRCALLLVAVEAAFLIAPRTLSAQKGVGFGGGGVGGAARSRPNDVASLETPDALDATLAHESKAEAERLLPVTLEQRSEKRTPVALTEPEKESQTIVTEDKHGGYIRLRTTRTHSQPNLRTAIHAAAPGRLPTSPADDRILEALDQDVNGLFNDTPLRSVIEQLARQTAIPITPDIKALTDAQIDLDATTVTQTASGTLRSALRLLLGDVDLTYIVKDGVLLITSKQCAEENLSLRLYRIPHETKPSHIIDLFQSVIQPQMWDWSGGPGVVMPIDGHGGRILLISQTEEVHEEIEQFIAMLPASDVGPHASEGPLEPGATPSRLYAITDPTLLADLEKKLVGLCNAALGDAADMNAVVSTLGGHLVVQSKSAAFHAYAADVVRCILGEEKTTREYLGIVPSDLQDGGLRGGIRWGMSSGGMGGMGGGMGGFCWVAREVYGRHDPRWLVFRDWITSAAPDWFRTLYERHGESCAAWLRDRPGAKAMVRCVMDYVVASRQDPRSTE
jgi:hypothetical protein